MAKQASIQLKNLTKEYVSPGGTTKFLAVDHINVNIKSGDFVTLLGALPNRCGFLSTDGIVSIIKPAPFLCIGQKNGAVAILEGWCTL